MTPEEHQAVKDKMAVLREVANKKRMDMAAVKREIKTNYKEAKAAELARKKELAETKRKNTELIEQELEKHGSGMSKARQPKKAAVEQSDDEADEPHANAPRVAMAPDAYKMFEMLNTMKSQLKEKYKLKYKAQPIAPPPPPPPPLKDVVKSAAKEVLHSRVQDEIRKMAYKSLFGSDL